MEAFLAFTPTSAQADTDLGFSLERDPEDPFRFLSQDEKELAEAADFYNSVDPITGGKISTAIAPQMATRESAEVLELQRETQAEQEKKNKTDLLRLLLISMRAEPCMDRLAIRFLKVLTEWLQTSETALGLEP